MPEATPAIGDVENDANLQQQRREWRLERIAWALTVAILIAGLAGLLGPHQWRTKAVSPDGSVAVEYDRFERYSAPALLTVRIAPPAGDGELRLAIDDRFAEGITVQSALPQPSEMTAREGEILCSFPRGGAAPFEIKVHYQHEGFGLVRYRVGLEGHPPAEVRQFVYP
jgi:hypothetical protein